MAAPQGAALAVCIMHAHKNPQFAVNVRSTHGDDLEVFVEHLEEVLWDRGPTRRLVAIAKEHDIPCELFTGYVDAFSWQDVFPLSVRKRAALSMANMHEYERVNVPAVADNVAQEVLKWNMRQTGDNEKMSTLRLFGNETILSYANAQPSGTADISRWTWEGTEYLHIQLPVRSKITWEHPDLDDAKTWQEQLSALQCSLTADEQFVFMVLSSTKGAMTLPAMYAAASYGAALTIPQCEYPAHLMDALVDGAPCTVCGSNLCLTASGDKSPMIVCPTCGKMCHEACAGSPCAEHDDGLETKMEAPLCLYNQGKVSACYGLVKTAGAWNASIGPWPIVDRTDGLSSYHPVVLAAMVQRAARCVGQSRWIAISASYPRPTLADAVLANAEFLFQGIEGKRVRQKAASVVGDILWYGHVMVCDRRPALGDVSQGGKIPHALTCTKGFSRHLATLSPIDSITLCVPTCLITPGVATTLLHLNVYHPEGYFDTYTTLRRLSLVTHVSLDIYVTRWITGGHGLLAREGGSPCKADGRQMHADAASILASSKVRRRALPCTPPCTWSVDQAPPVFACDPCSSLKAIVDDRMYDNAIAELWTSRFTWMQDPPKVEAHMDVGIPCDPCIDLAVRFSLNFDQNKPMHCQVHMELSKTFSEEFADRAFEVFENNQCSTLPPVLDNLVWETFRDRCVTHSEYGWLFAYMSVNGAMFDSQYSPPIVHQRSHLAPRLDPTVQRNVPWSGGWAQPKRLIEATDATFVDLGHGEAKYLSSLAEPAKSVVAFEIDLNAIRSAYANVKPRGSPKIHFVPVSWVGYQMASIPAHCVVAAAYRPGSTPPVMNHPRMHLLTADCDTAQDWGIIPDMYDTTEFAQATGIQSHSAWRHRASCKRAIEDAIAAVALKHAATAGCSE